ncbi:MAG: alanine--tRNA ligase-related protein [bacterium]
MQSKQLRQLFLDFMKSKGHHIVPSSSIIPKEDPTLLFVNSGMYPMIPYLLGQEHPNGTRITNSQVCIRTIDIEEVGDNRHLSMFEMLGSWSLGDYFKAETISWGFEFLTSKEWLGLDPERLFVTVYRGHGQVEEDQEAISHWQKAFQTVGIEPDVNDGHVFDKSSLQPDQNYLAKITKLPGSENWWGLPYKGPCGPDTEIFYLLQKHPTDFQKSILPGLSPEEVENFIENEVVEIWNHVFMQFIGEWGEGKEPVNLEPLVKKNIDTGSGFERLLMVINGFETVHQTDVLLPIADVVKKWSTK